MVTRHDVNQLNHALSSVSDDAAYFLEEFFRTVDLSRPEAVRDALLEVVPAVTREYGDLSATVAAEWYEETRAKEIGGRYSARLGATTPDDEVRGTVRWAAGELFGDNPEGTLALLRGALQRQVMYGGRDTIARNVDFDPSRPRWARVPSGAHTCAFCSMLASRGFVYKNKQGALMDQSGNSYHDDCHCQPVPSWDAEQAHIEGYDPDALFAVYDRAAGIVGNRTDTREITKVMRRLEPDAFTDGVHPII
jgi:hypothetical protein